MPWTISFNIPEKLALKQGEPAFLSTAALTHNLGLNLLCSPQVRIPAGTILKHQGQELLQVMSTIWCPAEHGTCTRVAALKALQPCNFPAGEFNLQAEKNGFSLATITLSDKAVHGQRQDLSGPAIEDLISQNLCLIFKQRYLIADSKTELKALLINLALEQNLDLILTTGGTGLAPTDVTPEATLEVVEKRLPGFEQAMLQTGLTKTPHAIISRAIAGSLGQCLIINLPGSPKAVRENLAPLVPALKHALNKLQGDQADCGT